MGCGIVVCDDCHGVPRELLQHFDAATSRWIFNDTPQRVHVCKQCGDLHKLTPMAKPEQGASQQPRQEVPQTPKQVQEPQTPEPADEDAPGKEAVTVASGATEDPAEAAEEDDAPSAAAAEAAPGAGVAEPPAETERKSEAPRLQLKAVKTARGCR